MLRLVFARWARRAACAVGAEVPGVALAVSDGLALRRQGLRMCGARRALASVISGEGVQRAGLALIAGSALLVQDLASAAGCAGTVARVRLVCAPVAGNTCGVCGSTLGVATVAHAVTHRVRAGWGARVAGARKTASQLSRGGVGVVSADSARFALFVSRRRLERSLRTCHTAVAVPPVSRLAHASSATGGAFRVARAGHARAVALFTLERVGVTNLTLAIQRVAGGAWGAYHLAVVFFVAAQARHAGKI